MKRKYEAEVYSGNGSPQPSKKSQLSSAPSTSEVHARFRPGLFNAQSLANYQSAYRNSAPYRHGIIPNLISDPLLRSVRAEVLTHISFTPKETDIYKIQQSGDLANLDGLDSAQMAQLPNLIKLRDALYSAEFRAFLEHVTGAGKLSGKKTDMAINIYTPGSYLLCHDDVIGSRRVSYILYLTSPDEPWQAEWGGALRLYPTENKRNGRGEMVKVPVAEHVKVIPPSWGQLSFFAVQPGESFHDVEEVYHPPKGNEGDATKRVRMAISGWYHIPQEGEDGYEEGLEQKLAERSSLSQLQGNEADEFDEPRPQFLRFDQMDRKQTEQESEQGEDMSTQDDPTLLTEHEFDLLLRYISPSYLTPEMTEQLASSFEENSFLQLDRFLCEKFADALKDFVSENDILDPNSQYDENECHKWKTARPPHKHRFLFQQQSSESPPLPWTDYPSTKDHPIRSLMTHLFPSAAFRKWLSIITGLKVEGDASLDLLARRFRRGKDYALASAYEGENPRLEFSFACTVSGEWERGRESPAEGAANGDAADVRRTNGESEIAGGKPVNGNPEEHIEVGGEEVYMAGDDEEDDHGHESGRNPSALAGKGKADPAIYRSSTAADGDGEDDAILFSDPPAWNVFSIVLRDRGTLRFVKYLSRAAQVDRWDVKGVVELGRGAWDEEDEEADEDEDGDGEGHGDGQGNAGVGRHRPDAEAEEESEGSA